MIDHKSGCTKQTNGECECQPKPCREPIPRCVEAAQHVPACRCVLDAGHEGPHTSTRPRIIAPAGTEPKPPKAPKAPSGSGGIGHTSDRTELTVNDMTQHVYQHQAEPRDLDYRAQAFSFALTSVGPVRAHVTSLIDVAAQIEEYLRNGQA